jgi:4'-phosphopantetheinyl transferase
MGPVNVWLVDPSARGLPDCASLLDDAERSHVARLRRPGDRELSTLAHGLARSALASCAGVEPRAWRFVVTESGEWLVLGPESARGWRFNLTHCTGLVGCAVACDRRVGLDAEPWRTLSDLEAFANLSCSPDEKARLATLPPQDRSRRLLSLWTVKEAYAKARGLGSELAFPHLGVELHKGGGRARLVFDPSVGDAPDLWRVELLQAGEHAVAVAVQRLGGDDPSTAVHRGWPA